MPDEFKCLCILQKWPSIEVKEGLREGKGVSAVTNLKKNDAVCNYGGGDFLLSSYVEEHLIPYEEKCNYLLEIQIMNQNSI